MKPMSRQAAASWLVATTLGAAVLVPLLGAGWWIWSKHQWGLAQLETVEPRHARLLGLRQKEDDIVKALDAVHLRQNIYLQSSQLDTSQTGNAVQQKVRDTLASAGLSVLSSQVQPVKELDPPASGKAASPQPFFETIPLAVSVEGTWEEVLLGLHALQGLRPMIWCDSLVIDRGSSLENLRGNFKAIPKERLSVRLQLSVKRSLS